MKFRNTILAHIFTSRLCWGLVLAALVLVADQVSKYWLLYVLDIPNQPRVVTPFFNLVMVWNYGISFGLFADDDEWRKYKLITLALAITAALLWWLWRAENRRVVYGLGLVIGGAVGNVIDRVLYGAVADFFDVHVLGYHWPAFNVADAAICIGVAILLIDSIFYSASPRSAPPPPTTPSEGV